MMNDREVVITGVGPVTSIGVGADAVWNALAAGRDCITNRAVRSDVASVEELPIASMPDYAEIPGIEPHVRFLGTQDCASNRDLAYSLLAIELAVADAGISYERESNNIGVIQAFEAPAVEATVSELFKMLEMPMPTDGPPKVYEHLAPFFYNMQPFLYVHIIGKAFGFHGYSTSVHNACTSGAFALDLAAGQIRSGQAEVMIVVGGEAFETAVRLEWFRRLELYAHDGQMRPFDATSSGFYVGEGAGAIVLESAAHAATRGAEAYGTYLGGAFAHQGWKQTIPDVRASRLHDVIERVLERTSRKISDVDLIVPHGAATQLSDGYEAQCLTRAMEGRTTHAVATALKPSFGHMLAASGIIETIGALLAMKHQAVPPTLNSHPESVNLPVPLVTKLEERPVRTVLKLSTGFTGHDAAILIAKSKDD
ncbi:MAG: hypothetical protein IIC02_01290 [Planctomycetes bacterium]|nr:hypothetical protein [Planctomycetota bacterium]